MSWERYRSKLVKSHQSEIGNFCTLTQITVLMLLYHIFEREMKVGHLIVFKEQFIKDHERYCRNGCAILESAIIGIIFEHSVKKCVIVLGIFVQN